jgi:hypothetical protein
MVGSQRVVSHRGQRAHVHLPSANHHILCIGCRAACYGRHRAALLAAIGRGTPSAQCRIQLSFVTFVSGADQGTCWRWAAQTAAGRLSSTSAGRTWFMPMFQAPPPLPVQVRVFQLAPGGTVGSRRVGEHGGRAHKLALDPENPGNCFYRRATLYPSQVASADVSRTQQRQLVVSFPSA